MTPGQARQFAQKKALEKQGVQTHVVQSSIGQATAPTLFDTGGGEKLCNKSIGIIGHPFGSTEAYMLQESPFCLKHGASGTGQ